MKRISVTYRGPLRGELVCPPDKSISHRAIILSSLAEGKSIVRNFLRAEDPLCTLEAFRLMGIQIEVKSQKSEGRDQNNEIVVNGKGLQGLRKPGKVIDCGNSGTTMRILSGVLAGQRFSSVLTGDSSLRGRPMQRVITPLSEMGALIESEEGYPPLRITGSALRPIRYASPVASAQVKSAILLAGLYCSGTTTVTEPGRSRDHTERMLAAGGVDVAVEGLEVSVTGPGSLRPLDMTVPGDLSSAAFFICAGLIVPGSELVIRNVGTNPTRSGLLDILLLMGAEIALENERDVSGEPVADVLVRNSALRGVDVGGELVLRAIDEFPILCVAAAKADGTTRITGAGELRVKESDRISSMAQELRKMAVHVEELEDGLVIEGREDLRPAVVSSYGDHRVAMSMAVAGLTASGDTIIEDTDCVNTSFPGYMDIVERLSVQK